MRSDHVETTFPFRAALSTVKPMLHAKLKSLSSIVLKPAPPPPKRHPVSRKHTNSNDLHLAPRVCAHAHTHTQTHTPDTHKEAQTRQESEALAHPPD